MESPRNGIIQRAHEKICLGSPKLPGDLMVSTMSVSSFLDGRSGNTTPATLDLHAAYATTINVNGQR
jgi:hypothetical protein